MQFKTFWRELNENSLYKTSAERDALVNDKARVAHALMFNFFGMLGMINAASDDQRRILLTFLRKDKKLRIAAIDDSNHDISLSLKLAHEAKMFKNDTIVNEITRFLVLLKAGQIQTIDNARVMKWAEGLKPEFTQHIKDPVVRRIWLDYKTSDGKVDISSVAVGLKGRMRQLGDTGDFKRYAIRFHGLTIRPPVSAVAAPAANTAATTATATDGTPKKMSWYMKNKLRKQAAAQAASAASAPAANTTPAVAPSRDVTEQNIDQVIDAVVSTGFFRRLSGVPAQFDKLKYLEDNFDTPKDLGGHGTWLDLIQRVGTAVVQTLLDTEDGSPFGLAGSLARDHWAQLGPPVTVPAARFAEAFVRNGKAVLASVPSADVFWRPRYYGYTTPPWWKLHFALAKHDGQQWSPALKEALRKFPTDDPEKVATTDLITFMERQYKVSHEDVMVAVYETFPPKEIARKLDLDDLVSSTRGYMSASASLSSSYTSSWGNVPVLLQVADRVPALRDMVEQSIERFPHHALMAAMVDDLPYAMRIIEGKLARFDDPKLQTAKWVNLVASRVHHYVSNMSNDQLVEAFDNYVANGSDYTLKKVSSLLNAAAPTVRRLTNAASIAMKKIGLVKYATRVMKLSKTTYYNPSIGSMMGRLLIMSSIYGIDEAKLLKDYPKNLDVLDSISTSKGIDAMSDDQVRALVVGKVDEDGDYVDGGSASAQRILNRADDLMRNVAGEAEKVKPRVLDIATTAMIDSVPTDTSPINASQVLTKTIVNHGSWITSTADVYLKAASAGIHGLMSKSYYDSMHKSDKGKYVDALASLMSDSLGTAAEDPVGEIIDPLPHHIKSKVRDHLVGVGVIADEISNGVIKPFDKLDNAMVKKIIRFNDITVTSLISNGSDGKKKKSETYGQFITRIKASIGAKNGILPEPHVVDSGDDNKKTMKTMVERDHAGRHGDVYPRVVKTFNVNMPAQEFWDFRKANPKDGTIYPAYHGTGGIAATMILRFGFRVIKASDGSVVGRMLGNGIYFSNKIDKAMQYVSNGGYSRQQGQRGYILELDTNLGTLHTDYKVAGVGGGSIRSPEWCVFNPRAQLRIVKAHEVQLVSRAEFDKRLSEGTMRSVKNILKEARMPQPQRTTLFVFRDGQIPIVDEQQVKFVDFEQAIADKLVPDGAIVATAQGPAIEFGDTEQDLIIDMRYGEDLAANDMQLYKSLFLEHFRNNMGA